MTETTYVYGETEVKLTGREATKPLVGGKKMTLVEITPLHDYDGTWKKFVPMASLLTIVDSVRSENQ